ncbi:MAG: undecaprenyl-diphosphate phosphatase [Deltaproteobacteria bacterium]|nr:undecaprenyl-diphosphate phosphatase [Deltaproteobacteria bacterium]
MNMFKAVIFGIIHGITEFLPIGSSAHLVIFQQFLGVVEPDVLFDVCLHLGTLLAVAAFYRRQVAELFTEVWWTFRNVGQRKELETAFNTRPALRAAILIIIGTIPTGIIGVTLMHQFEVLFPSLLGVGLALIITGLILLGTYWMPNSSRRMYRMGMLDAVIIGMVQGFAVAPGISRSGSTIAAALYLGLNRRVAAIFSFLLSIPSILGALILKLHESHHTALGPGPILTGTLVAALVGYLTLKLLVKVIDQGRLWLFAPYCLLVGSGAVVYELISK